MKRKFARLQRIDNNIAITKETHYDFVYHLQGVMLIALQEQGVLNVVQYRYAEEGLKQERIDRAKRLLEEGERQ